MAAMASWTGKQRFLRLDEADHSDTLGAVGVGGIALFHRIFGPLLRRNARLRAAYLAAATGGPLTDRHLPRAVALEYQRAGRLADDRLESRSASRTADLWSGHPPPSRPVRPAVRLGSRLGSCAGPQPRRAMPRSLRTPGATLA
jgi:hypothetical protein